MNLIVIDIVGQPLEALAVALSLQYGAHEDLDWSYLGLFLAFTGGLNVEILSELSLGAGAGLVDFVGKDQDWGDCDRLVAQES